MVTLKSYLNNGVYFLYDILGNLMLLRRYFIMEKNSKLLKKLMLAMIVAMGIVISPILRIEGMCPMAHFINILCSVILGPWYSLLCATLIGVIRMFLWGFHL